MMQNRTFFVYCSMTDDPNGKVFVRAQTVGNKKKKERERTSSEGRLRRRGHHVGLIQDDELEAGPGGQKRALINIMSG